MTAELLRFAQETAGRRQTAPYPLLTGAAPSPEELMERISVRIIKSRGGRSARASWRLTRKRRYPVLTIRDYIPSDWPRLCEIHDAARRRELALAGLEAAFLPLETAAEREGLFDYSVIVACPGGGAPAGFAAFSGGELAWLYVDPALSHRGIGRALAEEALRRMDAPRVDVEVLCGNAPALALYRSLGFRPVARESGHMPGNEGFAVTVDVLSLERAV